MVFRLYLLLFIWQVSFLFAHSFLESHGTPQNKDYIYLYNFLHNNAPSSQQAQTQAYNAVRIVWENSCASFNGMQKDLGFFALKDSLQEVTLCKQALYKARTILFGLIDMQSYRYDSGVRLAIALSYYLDNLAIYYDSISFFMQQWEELGSLIPKNLMKMTDYVDSIRTIATLCQITKACNFSAYQ